MLLVSKAALALGDVDGEMLIASSSTGLNENFEKVRRSRRGESIQI